MTDGVVADEVTMSPTFLAADRSSDVPLRVLVVDDTCLYREGVAAVVRQAAVIGDVATAADVATALAAVQEEPPAVVLLNLAMAGGTNILGLLRAHTPETKVVAMAVPEDDDAIVQCAEAGVEGWLLRSEPVDRLIEVLVGAHRGEALCSPHATAVLLARIAELARQHHGSGLSRLTEREYEVLLLLGDGLADKEIANRLCIALRTVKNHVHSILEKLDVRRRGEAVAVLREAEFRGVSVPNGNHLAKSMRR